MARDERDKEMQFLNSAAAKNSFLFRNVNRIFLIGFMASFIACFLGGTWGDVAAGIAALIMIPVIVVKASRIYEFIKNK